jgi:hypothetical protein
LKHRDFDIAESEIVRLWPKCAHALVSAFCAVLESHPSQEVCSEVKECFIENAGNSDTHKVVGEILYVCIECLRRSVIS